MEQLTLARVEEGRHGEEEARGSQYLTFSAGGQMYGIGILAIKEIIQYGGISTVPLVPEFISGVINLRGSVVPVVDLAARFSGQPTRPTGRSCIIIVEAQEEDEIQDVGVVVDSVSGVLDFLPADIEPAPAFGTHIKAEFISGMGRVNGHFIMLLNVQRVLALDALLSNGSAALQ